MLNLTTAEARLLAETLDRSQLYSLAPIKAKLAVLVGPQVPDPIPGQTTIYDQEGVCRAA